MSEDTTKKRNSKSDNPYSKWFSEGLTLFGLTACAYAVALTFEIGTCCYYGIPYYLGSVDLKTFLPAALIFFCLWCVFWYMNAIFHYDVLAFPESVYNKRYATSACVILPVLFLLRCLWQLPETFPAHLRHEPILLSVVFLPIVVLLRFFVYPYVRYWNAGTFTDRFRKDAEACRDLCSTIPTGMAGNLVYYAILFVVLFQCVFIFGYSVGTRRYYLVPEDKPTMVVLQVCGDRVLCAEFNKDKRIVKQKFRVFDLKGIGELSREKTGVLIPEYIAEPPSSPPVRPSG